MDSIDQAVNVDIREEPKVAIPRTLSSTEKNVIGVYSTIATAISEGDWTTANRHLKKVSPNVAIHKRQEQHRKKPKGTDQYKKIAGITASERTRIVTIMESCINSQTQAPISFELINARYIEYNF